MGLACGLMGTVGDDVAAVFEVRGEHAVVSGEVGAEARHEGGEAGDAKSAGLPICTAGGCPEGVRHTDVPHEFDGVEHDMSRPVTEGMLELGSRVVALGPDFGQAAADDGKDL